MICTLLLNILLGDLIIRNVVSLRFAIEFNLDLTKKEKSYLQKIIETAVTKCLLKCCGTVL